VETVFPVALFVMVALLPLYVTGRLLNAVYIYLLLLVAITLHMPLLKRYVKIGDFTRYLNVCYGVFLAMSILYYVGVIPNSFRQDTFADSFVYIGTIWSFYGLGGSTAHIDTYSAFMLVYSLKVSNTRWVTFVAPLVMLATLRWTPIIVLILILVLYYLLNRRWVFNAIMVLSFTSFMIVRVMSVDNGVYGQYLIAATHGRAIIWDMQLELMAEANRPLHLLSMSDINYSVAPGWWNLDGKYITDNSHNSYLTWLRRSPLVYLLLFISMLWLTNKRYSRRHAAVVLVPVVAAITNAEIFYVHNIVYITFVFISYSWRLKNTESKPELPNGRNAG